MSVASAQRLWRSSTILEAPPEYAAWYQDIVDRCADKRLRCATPKVPFSAIAWMTRTQLESPDCTNCVGVAFVEVSTIILRATSIHYRLAVQHEMLHLILGTSAHHREFQALGLREIP